MKKRSYLKAKNKKRVREFLIQYFYFNTVIGLPGPDINSYISYMKSKGAVNLELYENDKSVMIKQLLDLSTKNKNIDFVYGDILKASSDKKNTLYDLDFCATIRKVKEHVQKFNNNFIMTFCLRAGTERTIREFFKLRKEEIINRQDFQIPIYGTTFDTSGGRYLFIPYRDGAAMCCFAKIE